MELMCKLSVGIAGKRCRGYHTFCLCTWSTLTAAAVWRPAALVSTSYMGADHLINVNTARSMQAVGANTAMSILLTTSSNVISIFTVPLMLATVLKSSEAIAFDIAALIKSLIRTVLMPLLLGSSLRILPQVQSSYSR